MKRSSLTCLKRLLDVPSQGAGGKQISCWKPLRQDSRLAMRYLPASPSGHLPDAAAFNRTYSNARDEGKDAIAPLSDVPISTLSQHLGKLRAGEDAVATHQGLTYQRLLRGLECRDQSNSLMYQEQAVDISPSLLVDFPADISVISGQAEVIKVKVVSGAADGVVSISEASEAEMRSSGMAHAGIRVTSEDGSSCEGRGRRAVMEIEVPERYTHMKISSRGGNVSIAEVNEASLDVRTHGGSLSVGKVKASHAHCHTEGGKFNAKLLVAQDVVVCSSDVHIGRLMGKTICLQHPETMTENKEGRSDSRNGQFHVDACYADNAFRVEAGPVDVEIGTLSCMPAVADIHTEQGSIRIDSFDGLAKLATASRQPGSHISVHGQDNLAMLWVDAPHANVNLTLSPALARRVWCCTLPEVILSGAIQNVEGQGEALARKAAFEDAMLSSHRISEDSSEADLPSARFQLKHSLPAMLIETAGVISVSVESWIQSLKRRKAIQSL